MSGVHHFKKKRKIYIHQEQVHPGTDVDPPPEHVITIGGRESALIRRMIWEIERKTRIVFVITMRNRDAIEFASDWKKNYVI